MRIVGNRFAALERVAWISLDTVGQVGDAAEGAADLDDASDVKLSDRKCSPSEEFETNRLDGLS